MDKKQLSLFPELDLKSNEPIVHDGSSGKFINKFVEKEKGPFENVEMKKMQMRMERMIVQSLKLPEKTARKSLHMKKSLVHCSSLGQAL